MLGKKEKGNDLFTFGTEERISAAISEELVLLGTLRGKVNVGDEVLLINPRSLSGTEKVNAKVAGIEIGLGNSADTAEDGIVVLKLRGAGDFVAKPGTVCYSKKASETEVYDAYINALGNAYISNKKFEMTRDEYKEMSLGDCVEVWRIFFNLRMQFLKEESEEAKKETTEKLAKMAAAVAEKLMMTEEELYCVYNKASDKPFLFAEVGRRKDRTVSTPPKILLFTKPYEAEMKKKYGSGKYLIKKIEKGTDRKGILEFFAEAFYIDGAVGANVVYSQTAVTAQMVVAPPDLSNVDPGRRPVTNPETVRWLTMLSQAGVPENDEEKAAYSMYYAFLISSIMDATLIVPVKKDEKAGSVVSDASDLIMPMLDMHKDRLSLCVFTDWKKALEKYPGWGSMQMTLADIIEHNDVVLNMDRNDNIGMYIDKARYEQMKQSYEAMKKDKQQ